MQTILFTMSYSLFCAVCKDLEKRDIEYKTRTSEMGHSVRVSDEKYETGRKLVAYRKRVMKEEGLI